MPITFTLPQPDNSVGPGLSIRLQSDFIGPIPQDGNWVITVSPGGSELEQILSFGEPCTGHVLTTQILGVTNTGIGIPNYVVADGTQVQVHARIDTNTGVLDSGSITGTWRPTAAVGAEVFTRTEAQVSGGFTTSDRSMLQDVADFVQRTWSDLIGIGLSTPIGSALSHPDSRFLVVQTPCMTLSGRGALTRSGGTFGVNAFGLQLGVAAVPPGFGTREGVIVEYEQRVAQLAALYQTNQSGGEMVLEVISLRLDSYTWLWREVGPSRILYDVTPGCELTACWMLAQL